MDPWDLPNSCPCTSDRSGIARGAPYSWTHLLPRMLGRRRMPRIIVGRKLDVLFQFEEPLGNRVEYGPAWGVGLRLRGHKRSLQYVLRGVDRKSLHAL